VVKQEKIFLISGIALFLLLLFFSFKMLRVENPYSHIPREIATKVPNKLIGIQPRFTKRANAQFAALKPLKEKYLPTNVVQTKFQSIVPVTRKSVDTSLYDEKYKKKLREWEKQYGGMDKVPDSIMQQYPEGFTFLITDNYSRRFVPASVALLSRCKPVDGFDMPVGAPNGKGYYIAQIFGNKDHLGEDWNGHGGGNSDLGDPVYAIADGAVYWAKINGGSWGNIVRLIHNIGTTDQPKYIESLYAHLDEIFVREGQEVIRGQQIGTIGDANGHYPAHLHLEIRKNINTPVGKAYTRDTIGYSYVKPLPFIEKRRPWLWGK